MRTNIPQTEINMLKKSIPTNFNFTLTGVLKDAKKHPEYEDLKFQGLTEREIKMYPIFLIIQAKNKFEAEKKAEKEAERLGLQIVKLQ